MTEQARSHRKRRQGIVVSDRMDKTILVRVERLYSHPMYKKVVYRSKKYMAHDPDNTCRIGDFVEIMETRPLSRRKRWRFVRVLRRAVGYEADVIQHVVPHGDNEPGESAS